MAETVATYDFLSPPTQSGDLGTLGHYRVIDELGKGGMGYVFRAQDSKLQRSVALKVMNQKIAATANSRSRFIHEARAMAAVRHDNVATIFEVGESDGTPFMAMEMLKGGTLETFNKENHRLGYEKIIDYAQQIARGLAAAHQNGIVHRDIKPANIWIEEGIDRIKILDFGLALASSPVDHLSGRGAVIGTPGYLSPEQARSEPLDDRSDLYSLGVVLYELATGQLPLQAGSVSGQLIAILAHRPKPVDELNPDIPKPLCDLIHRLLRKEPRMRPQSAAALNAELDQVRKECDATSEVAQAISKLQVGLTQVVSKSDTGSLIDAIDEFPDTIADPLSNIPAAIPSAVGPAGSGRFVVPTGATIKSKSESAGPNWKLYAPLIVIVALIVTILPATAFFFSQTGRSTAPIIATELNDGNLTIDPKPAPPNVPPVGPAVPATRPTPEPVTRRAAEKKPVEDPVSPRAAPATQIADAPAPDAPAPDAPTPDAPTPDASSPAIETPATAIPDTQTPAGSDPPTAAELEQTNLAEEAVKPVAESPLPSDPGEDRSPTANPSSDDPKGAEAPEPKPTEPKPTEPKPTEPKPADAKSPSEDAPGDKYQQRIFSFRDKNYADVTLRKGTTANLSGKETINIWKRGGVEVEHIYLRFDLSAIKEARKTVDQAELVLTAADERPIGSQIRLYGATLPSKLMLWPESKVAWLHSPSNVDPETGKAMLDTFPVLAEQTVADPVRPADRLRIRFSDAALAKFIADSPHDVITLVLAGSDQEGKGRVEFVSSESDARKTRAPLLRLRYLKPTSKPSSDNDDESREDNDQEKEKKDLKIDPETAEKIERALRRHGKRGTN